jgi:polyisoprenoid-binding protein YceI
MTMRSWKMVGAALVLSSNLGSAQAGTVYEVDKSHSEVSFQVRHLVGKVRGSFKDFSAHIDADKAAPSVEFKIAASSIDTAEPKRDDHLRSADFFDVQKYPEITFKSDKVVAKGPGEYEATGTLTMHGVSKTVTLPVKVSGPMADPWGKERAGFEVLATLNRKDYGIVWNKALDAGGALLGDDVAVSINLETIAQTPAAAPKTDAKPAAAPAKK